MAYETAWTWSGSQYLREMENAHAVDVGARATSDDEAVALAGTILRHAAVLGMSNDRAAELAVLVLVSWQSRALLGGLPTHAVQRLWNIT